MSARRWLSWLLVGLVAMFLAIAAAGCGGDDDEGDEGATPTTQTGGTGESIKVGLVSDIGKFNDKSFNQSALNGLRRAERELGVEGRAIESNSPADYVPNLSSLAQQDYDLVIAVGFKLADAVDTVAQKYPDVNFAIIDFPQVALKHKPTNVQGLNFRSEQGAYTAGYLAALVAKDGGGNAISSVGGEKLPSVDAFIAAYQAGAKAAVPGIKTLNGYSQDFVDQAKCKELALNQIAQGSKVIFQVAGGCGLGALDAAKEKGLWGIGVDQDQSFLGTHILTSAVKRVDVSVFETIKSAQAGSFKGGDRYFDIKSGAVELGKISPKVDAALVAKAEQVEADIKSGKIKDIPTKL